MNVTLQSSRAVRIIAALAILAMPFAVSAQPTRSDATQGKRHAALHGPAVGTVTLTGTVTDGTTGAPVPEVAVGVGDREVVTDEQGQFRFPGLFSGSATVTFQRWGYQPATLSVTLVAGSTVNLTLAPKPVIILKDTQGVSHRADYELSQFGYAVLFGNLAKGDTIDLCKTTGEHLIVDKSTIAKISGPATPVNSSACCKVGPVLNINLTLKGGQPFTAAIGDSCFGDEVFAARDRDTLQWVYLKFTDIAEIDFPQ
jgi:hypothetical protein